MPLPLSRRPLVLAIATLAALTVAITAVSHRSRGHKVSAAARAASSAPAKLKSAHRPARPGSPTTTAPDYAPQRPFAGQLLIADRGNNRLIVVDAAKNLHW